ncbi:2-hydroxyacid dehydrogenase [Pseudomonas sp. KNUC1026]|uniref:2-hydroxyacid dehydrogenase n=1 Tax=Pseudomonas sp. KNUC1026 TaxID=2893890 RepID=UPI001F2E9577|nr:2-hydroxyacid dehydrogenase [Pseudomonas sp. KNUC1026]UFH48372.1 2-hydroxyacid dehydrogenase [Pseudomonas sp. KNUC1026]
MKIVMIGEAATHQAELAAALQTPSRFVALPRQAHESAAWDEQIEGADVLVAMRFKRAAPAPRFRLLHVPGAGLDGIDFAVLPEGCQVCNVFEHEIPMAEYAMACLLEHQIGLARVGAAFDSATFSEAYLSRRPRGELYGKTLLILGFGRIGQAVAVRARAFGIRVIAISSRARDGRVEGPMDEAYTEAELLAQLPRADFVVLSCPLNEHTRGAFGSAQLAAMRRDAVLVNIARAAVVDQQALYQALRDERIARAFLDVWYQYPAGEGDAVQPAQQPFETLPNAFCTPHISGWTHGLFERRYRVIAENIDRLARGEVLVNQVTGG